MELQQGHLIPSVTCRRLKSVLTEDAGRQPGDLLLNRISLELAQIMKAQGRLDEARQLCEGLSSSYSVRPPCLVCPPVSHAPALVFAMSLSRSIAQLNMNSLERAHLMKAPGRLDRRDSFQSSAVTKHLYALRKLFWQGLASYL